MTMGTAVELTTIVLVELEVVGTVDVVGFVGVVVVL